MKTKAQMIWLIYLAVNVMFLLPMALMFEIPFSMLLFGREFAGAFLDFVNETARFITVPYTSAMVSYWICKLPYVQLLLCAVLLIYFIVKFAKTKDRAVFGAAAAVLTVDIVLNAAWLFAGEIFMYV